MSIHMVLDSIRIQRETHLPPRYLSIGEKLQCTPFWAYAAQFFPHKIFASNVIINIAPNV